MSSRFALFIDFEGATWPSWHYLHLVRVSQKCTQGRPITPNLDVVTWQGRQIWFVGKKMTALCQCSEEKQAAKLLIKDSCLLHLIAEKALPTARVLLSLHRKQHGQLVLEQNSIMEGRIRTKPWMLPSHFHTDVTYFFFYMGIKNGARSLCNCELGLH